MKAITLWQPWASFIIAGLKIYETRSWDTVYRGNLAIHAGKKSVPVEDVLRGVPQDLVDKVNVRLQELHPAGIPTGCVLGVVNLTNTHPTERLQNKLLSSGDLLEYLLGNYDPGRFGWEMEVKEVFADPIPALGKQGLWNWDPAAAPGGVVS